MQIPDCKQPGGTRSRHNHIDTVGQGCALPDVCIIGEHYLWLHIAFLSVAISVLSERQVSSTCESVLWHIHLHPNVNFFIIR
jgi:hypothetical protein